MLYKFLTEKQWIWQDTNVFGHIKIMPCLLQSFLVFFNKKCYLSYPLPILHSCFEVLLYGLFLFSVILVRNFFLLQFISPFSHFPQFSVLETFFTQYKDTWKMHKRNWCCSSFTQYFAKGLSDVSHNNSNIWKLKIVVLAEKQLSDQNNHHCPNLKSL